MSTTKVAAQDVHNNDAQHAVKLKKEYILTERSPSLPPLPPNENETTENNTERTDDNNNNNNSRGGGSGGRGNNFSRGGNNGGRSGGGGGGGKKKRGMNKKRPRDAKINDCDKMCLDIVRGKTCPYGAEKCKYNHDLKAMLAVRPPDIKEVEGGCPNYNLTGHCDFGVTCRVGSSHLNMSTGQNIDKPDGEVVPPPTTMNVLSRDVQQQLRRKQYPFKCKRFFEEKAQKKKDAAAADNDDDDDGKGKELKEEKEDKKKKKVEEKEEKMVDLSPLPTKRKLIDFRNKVYIAPLTTVGNLPFRRIMKKYGADITCGEMAVASNLLQGKPSEWALLKRHPEEDVFGVQIAAGFPDQYTRIAEVLEKETTIDFIDLNLGCPIDIINETGSGAALMLREKRLRGSLEGISKALSCPITVKIRTGWDEKRPIAHELVPKIQRWGIDGLSAVMIHGRSRLQRYTKYADWDYIEKVANCQSPDLPQIPVIGNGDIFTFTQFEEIKERKGINETAMLARGALIKPWLPTEIKEKRHWDISASERLDMLKQFVKFGLEHWGSDQHGVNNTRRALLEWLSFLYRYVPVGLLEVVPQQMNQRPPNHMCGRSDLETLMLSKHCADWIRISEMLLGPVPDGFQFQPKHKANAYK